MENYYSCFTKYDYKGNRLSLFGYQQYETLWIIVFTCNKKDQFNKKKITKVFQEWLKGPRSIHDGLSYVKYNDEEFKPYRIRLEIEVGDDIKHTFQKAIHKHFYTLKEEYLSVKSSNIILIEENKNAGKLSKMYQNIKIKYLIKQ